MDQLRYTHNIMARYPTRVPVWIERARGETIPDVDRHKFLIERDMTMSQVIYIIRTRIKLSSEQAMFVFVGDGVLPATGDYIGSVYKDHAAPDGMLYIRYRIEKTFG